MKILSATQIREVDAYTISNEPIASIDLMERASLAFVKWIIHHFDNTNSFKVFCGTGNNGGDGLAISRLLSLRGYHVETFVVRSSTNESQDFGINFTQLSKFTTVYEISSESHFPLISDKEIVIDAMFGSGLTRPLKGIYIEIINYINASIAKVISVDLPSGLYCDDVAKDTTIIKANYTITFETPKLSFFLPVNYPYVGAWEVVNIGLNQQFISKCASHYATIDSDYIKRKLLVKSKADHKGTNGRALLIAGSYGKMGAAILASKAAMRSGLGLLTVHTPHCGYSILQTAVPEVMVSPDPTEFYFGEVPATDNYNAIGIGPGLDIKEKSVVALKELLTKVDQPMVLDADALNILALHPALIESIPENSIITPHFKEFERLLGAWTDDLARIDKQIAFAKKHHVIVVYKGPNTTIVNPEGEVYFNTTGNPGMATAGSGDVLTGIITGLLGQGHPPLEAAKLGVYLHGLAGDIAVEDIGKHSLMASDINEYLPNAFLHLSNNN